MIPPHLRIAIFLSSAAVTAAAQSGSKTSQPQTSFLEDYGLFLGIPVILGLVAAVFVMRKKKAEEAAAPPVRSSDDGVRLKFKEKPPKKEKPPQREKAEAPKPAAPAVPAKTGFAALPINSFVRVQRTNPYLQLPESHDHDLLTAIEQTNEESEEDVQVRTQALKLLSTFKTANSVAAISQMALYDLTSKLRSDAVTVLAEMDHESVFEAIVTACADPTREVRAAAARGLFKLTFDRAHAWARVIESGDMARMRHVARCAIEGDLVERSFDRLVHPDRKVAYEAFTLTALLIRAGETEPIFKTLANHPDENVKLALLHVLQTVKEENTYEELSSLLSGHALSSNVAAKVNEVRSSLQMVQA